MTILERYAIELCDDCVAYLANGEAEDAEDWPGPAAIKRNWPNEAVEGVECRWELVPCSPFDSESEDEWVCEPFFAGSPCDGCGTSLGGQRHESVALLVSA